MGNKESKSDFISAPNETEIEKRFKWSMTNTKSDKVHKTAVIVCIVCIVFKGKIYACDCRRVSKNEEKESDDNGAVLFATTDQGGHVVVTQVNISTNKKNKVTAKCKEIDRIQLRSSWSMALAMSPSGKYIGNGGLDNLCTIYTKTGQGKYDIFSELQGHIGYLSCIKFIEQGNGDFIEKENLVLTTSGDRSVRLWDIQFRTQLLSINDVAQADVMAVDHIYIDNKHLIAFCDCANTVYIREITETINKYQNKDDDDNKENDKIIFHDQDIDIFESDVNDCKFSPNGEFLAATSDDGHYAIYAKNYKYDSFWDVTVIEWTFLCKRNLHKIDDALGMGTCLRWADCNTLFVGTEETDRLFSTYMEKKKNDPNFVNAINYFVDGMIKSLPENMRWIGLVQTVTNEILLYFNEYEVFDYKYKFSKTNSRISCITSCQWNKSEDNDKSILFFGGWDKQSRMIFPQ